MAQKRINKNLVAFITIMVMVISVVVVAMATYYGTQKDPEKYARKAQELEKNGGDLSRAIDLYRKSYEVSKDVKYLVEASRCAYAMGDVRTTFQTLEFAQSQQPDDVNVLVALLERFWELKDYDNRYATSGMRDYAEKLLRLQKDNVFGLVCMALALQTLSVDKPENKELAAKSLERAVQLQPMDPRVVMTRANQEITKIFDIVRNPQRPPDWMEQVKKLREQAAAFLKAGHEARPEDAKLTTRYAEVLLGLEQVDEGRRVLEAGVAARPDDAELHMSLAGYILQQLNKGKDKLDPAEFKRLLEEGRTHAVRAAELEPAMYQAYMQLVQFRLIDVNKTASASADTSAELAARYQEALKIYDNAIQSTIGRKSIRAALNAGVRPILMMEAFQTALSFYVQSTNADQKKAALEQARKFLADTQSEYPDSFVAHFLRGQLQFLEGDFRSAIQSFTRAEEKTRDVNRLINRLANERLAMLHAQETQTALAFQYADRAIRLYQEEGLEPSQELWTTFVRLLVELDQPQKALDYAADLRKRFPNNQTLVNLQAAALTKLGRGTEAEKLLGQMESPNALLMQAKVAAYEKQFGEAEAYLRKFLEGTPENAEAIGLLAQVAVAQERREQGRQFLQGLLSKITRDEYKRLVQKYDIVLAVADPKERAAKMLAIIEQIPDEGTRAAELYNFYGVQGDYDKAAAQLDVLEKLRPNEPVILEQQFSIALLRKDWARAEKNVIRLADKNADLARGAVYRGRLALAKDETDKAIAEFQAARRDLPVDSRLNTQLARALVSATPPRYEEAVEILKQTVEKINPRDFEANRLLYAIYEQLGRRQEGVTYLQQAAKLNAADPFIQERMQFLEEENDPTKGVARREALRQKEPQNLANLIRLAQLYAKTNNTAKAEEIFRAAAAINIADPELAYSAMEFYAQTKNRDGGDKFLRDYVAAQKERGKVRAQMLLGLFCERIGDYATARDHYLEADRQVDELIKDPKEQRLAHVETGFQLIDFYARWRLVKEMIEACRRVLDKLEPQETNLIQRARLGVIDGLLKTKRHGDAEKEVETYLKDYPKDTRGLVARAQLQLARSQLREAARTLSLVLEQDREKENAWALFTRGSIYFDLGQYKEALTDLTNAKRIAPTAFGMAHRMRLANVYEVTNQIELAISELKQILELQPSNTGVAQRILALMRAARQMDKAQQLIREWMARQPQEGFWPYQLGLLLLEQQEYPAAIANLKSAVDLSNGLNPRYTADWLGALVRADRSPEAVRAFETLRPEQISALVRATVAEAYLRSTPPQRDKALVQMEQSLLESARNDQNETAVLAMRMAKLLKPDEVVGLLNRLVANPQNDPDTSLRLRNVLANCLVEIGSPADSLKVLDPVLTQAQPGTPERLQALLLQAQAFHALKDFDRMQKAYEQMLREDENNVNALNNLAYVLADELKRPQEALKYAEQLHRFAEDRANVLDTVGWVYALNGKKEEALQVLKQALAKSPDNLDITFHMAKVYEQAGRGPDARETYRRLLDAAKKRNDLDYVRKAEEALGKLQ